MGAQQGRRGAKSVLGEPLVPCSLDPLTGFYRNGCCDTGRDDHGLHIVCAQMTDEFLAFSKQRGNDLSTPVPEFDFPGLKLAISGACVHCGGKKRMKRELLPQCD